MINDYTDGENVIDFELGDLLSSDMDDIRNMIAQRIENMIIAEIRDHDLPLSMGDFISMDINSLDITVNFELQEEEEDEYGDLE